VGTVLPVMPPGARPYDVLVVGEINPDLILRGADVEPAFGQVEKWIAAAQLTVGSSNVIFACAAAKLGLRVAFVGLVGDDLFGAFMLQEMARCGLELRGVRQVQGAQTGLSVILQREDGDRAILTFPGVMRDLRAEEVPEVLLRQARHVHVGSFFLQTGLQPGLPALFRRARALGLTTSLDPNYDPAARWEPLRAVLPYTDIFLPNEQEALAFTDTATALEAGRALATQVQVVAVKRGARGALAVAGSHCAQAHPPQVTVVDTVGAGDAFDAGFLWGLLRGWPLASALRLGVVVGALSTRAAGGTAAQPTLQEALAWLPRISAKADEEV